MATKPTNLAVWATGAAPITEPLLAEKQAGWAVASKPPAQWFNWWMKLVHQWLVWLDAFEADPHTWVGFQTFNTGIRGYGNNLNPGIRGDSGGSGFAGVHGYSTHSGVGEHAVLGTHTHANGTGVKGEAFATGGRAIGVRGQVTTGEGVNGEATSGIGVSGESATGIGGNFSGGAYGVRAESPSIAILAANNGGPGGVTKPAGLFVGGDANGANTGRPAIYAKGGGSGDPADNQQANSASAIVAVGGIAAGSSEIAPAIGDSDAGSGIISTGGAVQAEFNSGSPGAGVVATGGGQIDPGFGGVRGGSGVVAIGGTADGGKGYSVDADGDMRLNGQLEMVGADKAMTAPQTNLLTAGLLVKAWARIRIASGSYQLLGGQNIASLVAGTTPTHGQFKLNLAAAVPRATRIVIAKADTGGHDISPYDYAGSLGANDTTIGFEVINRPTDGSAVTTVDLNTQTVVAHILVLGLQ